jgi:CopG family nickel-responsive transcriptional regulator
MKSHGEKNRRFDEEHHESRPFLKVKRRSSMERLARFSVSLPESLLEEFDVHVEATGHKNRSEALRHLIRDFIAESCWECGTESVYGTITITYDHHSHDTAQELTALQHDFGQIIVCSTHVHIDHDHCFEVIVLRGPSKEAKRFVEALSGLKSVYSTKPVFTVLV